MSAIEILILTGIFGVLVCCIYTALKRSALFSGANTFWLSLCVSLLCVIAMFGIPNSPRPEQNLSMPAGLAADSEPSSHRPWDLPSFLIPYAALGISILTVLIFILISRLWGFSTKGKKVSAASIDRLIVKQSSEVGCADKLHKRKIEPSLENQDNMSDRKHK